jgi:hypothetical protein
MVNVAGMTRPPFVERAFGSNGTGGVIIPGARVGDIVVGAYNIVTGATAATSFETTVSVFGQVQQTSSSNFAANEYYYFVMPQGAT